MIYSNLWRHCVSTREYPAKFIKPRGRKSRAKRVSSKKSSPLKRALLPPPEKPEPEHAYKEPFSEPYFEKFTKRKRRTGIFKRRRHTRWDREQPECHTKLWELPTYKKGHIHLLKDGYIDFINAAYGSGSLVLTRWDVEKAWAKLVGTKFEEWHLGKRLTERGFKTLGKALSKVDTSRSRKCFDWWERIQRRRALADLYMKADIDQDGATDLSKSPTKIRNNARRRASPKYLKILKGLQFRRREGANEPGSGEGSNSVSS